MKLMAIWVERCNICNFSIFFYLFPAYLGLFLQFLAVPWLYSCIEFLKFQLFFHLFVFQTSKVWWLNKTELHKSNSTMGSKIYANAMRNFK